MGKQNDLDYLVQRIDLHRRVVDERDRRYRGKVPLAYHVDELRGEFKTFGVNVYRLAVNAVAERMRVTSIDAEAYGRDVSSRAWELWKAQNLDQTLTAVLADAMALGAAYWTVWVDGDGNPAITAETAAHMAVARDPITGEVTAAVKRWFNVDELGVVQDEYAVHYTADRITLYKRGSANTWEAVKTEDNPLEVVPVVPMVNFDRLGDEQGYSVIDDMAPLVDALGKLISDMLITSESVAKPKRWAAGIVLPDADVDGFTADDDDANGTYPAPAERDVANPFEDGSRVWTTEDPAAKFGQLPGADLKGYETAVAVIMEQISALTGLPPHMLGESKANPSSADAIRAAETSLTARAEGRIRVLGLAVENAVRLLVAVDAGIDPADVVVNLNWADASTRSYAQEVDGITKLVSLGIMTIDEGREKLGLSPRLKREPEAQVEP